MTDYLYLGVLEYKTLYDVGGITPGLTIEEGALDEMSPDHRDYLLSLRVGDKIRMYYDAVVPIVHVDLDGVYVKYDEPVLGLEYSFCYWSEIMFPFED